MIKSLKVKRQYRKELTTILPYGIPDISIIKELKIDGFQKAMMLFEQGLLLHYLRSMVDSKQLEDYSKRLSELTLATLPSNISNRDIQHKYDKYRNIVFDLVINNTINTNSKDFYYDRENFKQDSSILPKEFVLNYLKVCTKIDNNENLGVNPVLLIPHKFNGDIVFKKEEFLNMNFKEELPIYLTKNNTLEFISRLNWKSKNMIQVLDTIQSFNAGDYDKFNKSLYIPAYINGLMSKDISPMIDTQSVKLGLLDIINYYNVNKSVKLDNSKFGFILSLMGYDSDVTDYLTEKDPTIKAVESFNMVPELKSFKRRFAEGDEEEEESEDDENTEDTPDDIDDTSTDDDISSDDDMSSDDGDDDFSDDSSSDDFSDDTGDSDDFGGDSGDDFGDDSGFDDNDMGDSDSSDGGDVKEDTVSVPKDPVSVIVKVVKSETMNEYIERNALIENITKLLQNPPRTMSSDTIAFLDVWLTQWINMVSLETTKEVLSRLGL